METTILSGEKDLSQISVNVNQGFKLTTTLGTKVQSASIKVFSRSDLQRPNEKNETYTQDDVNLSALDSLPSMLLEFGDFLPAFAEEIQENALNQEGFRSDGLIEIDYDLSRDKNIVQADIHLNKLIWNEIQANSVPLQISKILAR